MRKINRVPLLLTAALFAAISLIPDGAIAGVGDIYESNQGTILRFTPSGGTPAIVIPNLSNPKGIAFDGNGHVFVADATRNTIYRFTSVDGSSQFTFAAGLSSPVGLTFDAAGFLYSSDAGSGAIFKFSTLDGTKTTFAIGVGAPAGLGFDSYGNLFVADFAGGAIVKIAPDGGKTVFASGLNFPAGIAIDSSNNVFVSDSGSGIIFKFAPDGSRTSFAEGLESPYGLAFEASGNLIESDKDSGATFRFTPAGVRTTIFQSDFNTPQFVAVEPAPHQVLNMSTRGYVQTSDHLLIAGFIINGTGPVGATVVVRALGPSLSTSGITDPLPDPALEIRDAAGVLVASNDNWAAAPAGQIVGAGFVPSDNLEAALQLVLGGGSYTAIVYGAGFGGTTGTALVEVYHLQ